MRVILDKTVIFHVMDVYQKVVKPLMDYVITPLDVNLVISLMNIATNVRTCTVYNFVEFLVLMQFYFVHVFDLTLSSVLLQRHCVLQIPCASRKINCKFYIFDQFFIYIFLLRLPVCQFIHLLYFTFLFSYSNSFIFFSKGSRKIRINVLIFSFFSTVLIVIF